MTSLLKLIIKIAILPVVIPFKRSSGFKFGKLEAAIVTGMVICRQRGADRQKADCQRAGFVPADKLLRAI